MFERLKRLYNTGKITIEELHNAVDNGWITEEQFIEIIAGNIDDLNKALEYKWLTKKKYNELISNLESDTTETETVETETITEETKEVETSEDK